MELVKKTEIYKFALQVNSNSDQLEETEELPHDDMEASTALVAVNNTYPQALLRSNAIGPDALFQRKIVVGPRVLLIRQVAFSSLELFLREIVVSSGELHIREVVIGPNALLLREIVVSSDGFLLREVTVSPGTLLLQDNVVFLDILLPRGNLASSGELLLREVMVSSDRLHMREIVVSSGEFRMIEVVVNLIAPLQHIVFLSPSALLTCDNVIRPGSLLLGDSASHSARNIIDSPGAPLLRDLTVGPSLLLQRCIATSSGVLQLPVVIAGTDEPQQADEEAEIAHVDTAVTRRVLRLAPGLAADSDMPTSARPGALSAPSDYAADRNSIIVLRPVRRRAFSARSIPMSQLMDFTSNIAPQRRLSQQASVVTTPALRPRNTMPSLPLRIGANSAPSSPAQAPFSVANKQVPMPPPPARVASLGDLLTAAAEAVDSSPELETIAEEDDGIAALGDACDEAFSSTGSIDTDFDPFQQASFSSLAPAKARPLDQQELNGTPVTGRFRSPWPGNELSPQMMSRYSERQASTAYSMYSSSSLVSNSMQSLWQEVDPSTERFSTLSEFTASHQQPSTTSLADTASAVSPRKRDILKSKLLGRSPSTISLRSALRPSRDQASDSGVERVSTPRKLSLSGALKSLNHKTSSKFGLNASSTTTKTPSDPVSARRDSVAPLPPEQSNAAGPNAPRRASPLSLRAFMRRPRSEASAPSADQAVKRESSGHSDESGQAL
ncbi:hypothetical protein IWW39_002348 [Coemansia spiralis]|uniref:Uncharacterized protein n=1 Tax=Coemansia spiralis TaxID=417178 RepID=A0A9W8GNH4_9FUNG|nr:hypothetical protein IWW39_002348 [Coemansia spiralis]